MEGKAYEAEGKWETNGRTKKRKQDQGGDEAMEKCGREGTRVGRRLRDKEGWKVRNGRQG